MGKRLTKKDVDNDLMNAIFLTEQEWKQIQSIVEKSFDLTHSGMQHEKLARSKYLFLLREARYREMNAMRV
ncbi:YaaL family protein [Oceanobacillus rekensis]|uniref:YaaL family protein n=1 Tax=Oceanobacillus rekensis TaxID=937927 RepID=UPI000B444EA6|nr:YaaL family protein [Oceanobacillus rekensis]